MTEPSVPTRPDGLDAGADDPTIPGWTRAFAYGLIALVLVCGVTSTEQWPLSGFKLFSAVRGPTTVSWELRPVVDGDEQADLSFAEDGAGFGYSVLVLSDFDEMTAAERDDICAAWVQPLRDDGTPVDELRVYRITKDIRPDTDVEPVTKLMWTCARS
jgi:hypothetical protein